MAESDSLGQSKEIENQPPDDHVDKSDNSMKDASVQTHSSASSQADAELEEDNDQQETSSQSIEDSVSSAGDNVREFRSDARVAGFYFERLGARVCTLEDELHEMQIQIGVKKRENNL